METFEFVATVRVMVEAESKEVAESMLRDNLDEIAVDIEMSQFVG